jgi:mono/diheme cytochrome c family protein
MRAFIFLLARLVGALLVLVLAAAVIVFVLSSRKLTRHYTVVVASVPVPNTPEAIARGQHVATIRGCLSCHGPDLGGALVMDNAAMGRVYGPNLTAGKGGHGARLHNDDWVRAVREGIRSDGRPLFIMPSKDFVALSDEDLGALLAFIASAAPVDREVPPLAVGPVSRALLAFGKNRLSAEVIDHARAPAAVHIRIEISPEYGRYLASTCSGCHNPHFSGGKIAEGPPDWPPAANLTQGPGSAVAGWSGPDFIRVIRTAVTPAGKTVNPVMPRAFGQMSDLELKALWSYLQTLPPAATGHSPAAGT